MKRSPKSTSLESPPHSEDPTGIQRLQKWHFFLGWGALLVFLLMGLALESLHGIKASFYLDPRWEVRRTMWRLGHSHGALFAIIHILFALTLGQLSPATRPPWRLASGLLTVGLILLPVGFVLGGVWTYEGDPGLGIFLVPVGACAMAVGVGLAGWRFRP